MTKRFVDEALALPPQMLVDAFERMLDLRVEGGKEASRAAVPSAAENSELERRITLAVRLRRDELDGFRRCLVTEASVVVSTAARAVLKRSRLTAEQYDVLVRPLSEAGVDVPPYRA
ncbi:hypothetical protein [Streptomyces sp. NPDC057689]|uniref:hypothetical protein n=1 Tax=Streptomyces sp. NPDC057689 TaxID=3346213 RepID=UPI003686D5E6